MREQNFCYQLYHPIIKEFKVEKFSLTHEPVDDFFKSQWQNGARSVLWLLYRWFMAIFFTLGVLGSLIQHFNDGIWFIYLTDWGFLLCMYINIFGAILATIYYFHPNKFLTGSKVLKLYWISHWSTLTIAAVITFIYWLFIFPTDETSPTAVYNLWAHAFNSIVMVLDHMLVAFPTRLLHGIYPLAIGLVYCIFSVIYYVAGGLNENGQTFIYEILNWEEAGWALLTVFGCLVLMIIFCFIFFGLYKLRSFLYRKTSKRAFTINP